jgi:hypothetical protein
MSPVGFNPTIPASARPQTYTFARAATGIGSVCNNYLYKAQHLLYSVSDIGSLIAQKACIRRHT